MGLETYKVSITDLFGGNRQRLIEIFKEQHEETVLYLKGGPSETRFDSDHEPIFRQESYFQYLCGVKEPDCSLVIDVAASKTILLIPRLPPEYATIMGKIASPQEWQDLYLMDEVRYTDETNDILKEYCENKGKTLLLMKGLNSDSGKTYEPPPEIVKTFSSHVDTDTLFPILAELRVFKSQAELGILRYVTQVTSFGHAYVMRNIAPGMMEYQGESLFRHYCYYNYGCRLVGYTPICGCGPNSAVLHYGHSGEPNSRQSAAGDTCLFDMGGCLHKSLAL